MTKSRYFKINKCKDCGAEVPMRQRKKETRCDVCTNKFQVDWRKTRHIKEIVFPE